MHSFKLDWKIFMGIYLRGNYSVFSAFSTYQLPRVPPSPVKYFILLSMLQLYSTTSEYLNADHSFQNTCAGRSLEVLFIITMQSAVPFINTKSLLILHDISFSFYPGWATISVMFLSVMHYQHSFSLQHFVLIHYSILKINIVFKLVFLITLSIILPFP